MTLSGALMLLALRGVPRHLRASVHGDLLEAGGGLQDALAIALHFQAEAYRAANDRWAALLLLFGAATLLATVPLAAQALVAQAAVFAGVFSLALLLPWGAPTLLAAVACGLLLGRAPGLAQHADALRLHLLLLHVPAAMLAAPDALQATLAAALLPAAAWLGWQNRLAAADEPHPA